MNNEEEPRPSSSTSSKGIFIFCWSMARESNLGIYAVEALKKTSSQHKVRTSLKDRTLESMFPVANPAKVTPNPAGQAKAADALPGTFKAREVKESECFLTSVQILRRNLIKGKHKCMLFLPGFLTQLLKSLS